MKSDPRLNWHFESLFRFASLCTEFVLSTSQIISSWIGPLQEPVTWYGINYTGTQMTQWDFQNKGISGWTGKNSFVLEVPLRYLRPSVIYSVPCDRILQRAYWAYSFRRRRVRLVNSPDRLVVIRLVSAEFVRPTHHASLLCRVRLVELWDRLVVSW